MLNATHRAIFLCALAAALGGCGSPNASETQTAAEPERGPRSQPGAEMTLYTPQQHELYDGHFIISGSRIYQAGTLNDSIPWDHMGDDASNLRQVPGTIDLDVNEIQNTGTFRAELQLPEGAYVVTMDEVREFSPCQDGGIAAFIYEHGDSGCGDMNWPKSLLYVAGWGIGSATLNGQPLYDNYQLHFMVTQGMRDRETLATHRLTDVPQGDAGLVNPAAMQLDFYIRSPDNDDANTPNREVFDHFFATEVTWK